MSACERALLIESCAIANLFFPSKEKGKVVSTIDLVKHSREILVNTGITPEAKPPPKPPTIITKSTTSKMILNLDESFSIACLPISISPPVLPPLVNFFQLNLLYLYQS